MLDCERCSFKGIDYRPGRPFPTWCLAKPPRVILPGDHPHPRFCPHPGGIRQSYTRSVDMQYCCDFMREQLTHTCELHGDGGKCPDVLIEKARFQGGEGQIILIARNAEYGCNFCPYCGTKWESVNPPARMATKNAFMHRSLCPYAGTCKLDISECLTCTGPSRGV